MKTVDIEYSVERRRRKTIEIAVHPGGWVAVAAPLDATDESIERLIEKRELWILRQILFFRSFEPRIGERYFIPGETHLILGRRYRLRVIEGKPSVALEGGHIIVATPDSSPDQVARIMEAWSRRKARLEFPSIFEEAWDRFAYPDDKRPRFCVKAMARRWGSLSASGAVMLNIALLQAPPALHRVRHRPRALPHRSPRGTAPISSRPSRMRCPIGRNGSAGSSACSVEGACARTSPASLFSSP